MANQEITFPDNEYIVSKTDLKGKITYGNALFIQISGYTESELLEHPHNVLRHEDMPTVIFALLWERIRSGKEIFAYVKNKTKYADYYWVFAHVTPSFDANRSISNYHSVRRKPSANALKLIVPFYAKLLDEERTKGIEASHQFLNRYLEEKGMTYDQFIFTL